jgi:hypothetical protein
MLISFGARCNKARPAPTQNQLTLTTFTESGLQFSFGPQWAVKQYDAHRFFQGLSGAGLKGVDFIATDGERLLLVEAKNYRPQAHLRQSDPLAAVLAAPEAFAAAIAQKAADTLRGIAAIGGYYERKWLFRLLRPGLLRLRPSLLPWRFWAHVHQLAQSPERITLVLCLETEQPEPGLRRQIAQSLEQRLQGLAGEVKVVGNGGGVVEL